MNKRIILSEKIFNSILKASNEGVPVDKEKLVALVMVNEGMARRTTLGYINALIISGKVKELEDGLWITKRNIAG